MLDLNNTDDYMNEFSVEDIDLNDFDGLFHLVFNQEEATVIAESNEYEDNRKRVVYKITKRPSEIEDSKKWEILDYRLGSGNYNKKEEKLLMEDIFMHGEFLEVISAEDL